MYKEDLSFKDGGFQYAVVKELLEDPNLLSNINDILDQNAFPDPYIKRTVGVIKDYFKKYDSRPSYEEVKDLLNTKARSEDEYQLNDEVIKKCRGEQPYSSEYVQEEITKFMKWKRMTVIRNLIDDKLIKGGTWNDKDFSKIANDFNDVQFYGISKSKNQFITGDLMIKAFTESIEEIIPTDVPGLDKYIGGGLRRGDVGLVTARSGLGKTTFATILAHNIAAQGLKALQIYFEDQAEAIVRKHSAIDTRISISNLIDLTDESAEKVKDSIPNMKLYDNLLLSKMPLRITVEEVEVSLINIVNTLNFRPDVIILDYFGCLKFSRNPIKENMWEAQDEAMRKIKAIAEKYKVAFWVFNQVNRAGSMTDGKAGAETTRGSIGIIDPVSITMQITRTKEQADLHLADLHIGKNRHGQNSDFTFEDITFDNGRMIIDCSDTKEYDENDQGPLKLVK